MRRLAQAPRTPWLLAAVAAWALAASASAQQPGDHNAITDVPGVKVGHHTATDAPTGTTVVLVEEGAVGAVDVRGSAPGTRETDLLDPENLVQEAQAVVLSGGSAFGLDAAGGVMRYLRERGLGYPVGEDQVVPIVPGAILFDLGREGNWDVQPDAEFGYRAAEAAVAGPVEQGSVGAGRGARAGGIKGGVGSASIVLENGIVVGALVAVNAVGSPVNPDTGELYAAFLEVGDEFGELTAPQQTAALPALEALAGAEATELTARNTTLGVIATNAQLSKAQAQKVAQAAHDGFARAIRPSHTMFDGDTIFTLATGDIEPAHVGELNEVAMAAADVMARAIVHAMLSATTVGEMTSYCDLYPGACGDE